MKLWVTLSEGLRTLFQKRRLEDDMAEEMRFHMEMQVQSYLEMGMTPEEAQAATRRKFGHIEGIKETARDERTWVSLEQLKVDLAQAAQSLNKTRGFLFVSVLTLALAIGFCTTVFSLANPILFKPLAFAEPERLIFVQEKNLEQGIESMSVSYADFLEFRSQNRVFTDIGVYDFTSFTIDLGDHSQRILGGHVSANLFDILGVRPILGSGFSSLHEIEGYDEVCLLRHRFWKQHFNADPDVVGKSLTINGRKRMVLGVMPESFAFQGGSGTHEGADFWIPQNIMPSEMTRGRHSFLAIARLKPGVSIERAQSELNVINERLARQFPTTNKGISTRLRPLRDEYLDSNIRTISWSVLGAVGFVLAIACANVANLFLARAFSRRKEFAIRAALGAGRLRTIQRLMCEGFIIALVAGSLGLLIAFFGVKLVVGQAQETIPHWISFSIDWQACLFAVLVSLLTCVLFGLAPAWRISCVNIQEGLNETGRGARESRDHSRLRSILILAEIVLASVLLCGTGLLVKTVIGFQKIHPGFDATKLYVFPASMPGAKVEEPRRTADFYWKLVSDLSMLPGVKSASASSSSFTGDGIGQLYHVEGSAAPASGILPVARLRVCTPGYFTTLGIPILAGRDFSWKDGDKGLVTIVDAGFARRNFQGLDPIGQRIRWGTTTEAPVFEIVGVVGDVRYNGVDTEPLPGFYVPHPNIPYSDMAVHLRTESADTPGLNSALRSALLKVDRRMAFTQAEPVANMIERSYWRKQLLTQILGAFSVFALVLSSVGIAGMIAYSVVQRSHEIGVRIALGARPTSVVIFIMRQGMSLVLGGLAIGLLLCIGLSRLFVAEIFGASLIDPATLAACAVLFAAVSAASCFAPVHRITRMNPMTALRAE